MPHFSLLAEYAGEDDESGAIHAPYRGSTPPLDPEERAAIVEEAIADMVRREQQQYDDNLQLLSSLGTPRKKTPEEKAAAKKRKMDAKNRAARASDGTITSMKSEVFLLPKGGPIIRKVTFMKPEPEADDGDDDLDDLGRQLKEIRRMQRHTSALEQKLASKQRQLQEVLLRQAEARKALTTISGRKKMGRPRRVEVEDPLLSAGDPLMVLRSEEEPADLLLANDLFSVPADLTEAKRMIFSLRQEVLALRNSALKHAHTATIHRIDTIGKEVKRDMRHAAVMKRMGDALSSVFSPAQQSRLLKNKKLLPWTSDDYMRAIMLRSLCRRRTFEYVRNVMKIPMPSMFALRSAAAFGRYPEVSRAFKELREQKRLSFITGSNRAKQTAQLETEVVDAAELPDELTLEHLEQVENIHGAGRPMGTPRRRGRGRGGGGRGRAGAALARKRTWLEARQPISREEDVAWQTEEVVEEVVEGEEEQGVVMMETPSPQKPCWNAVDLTELIEFEHEEHSSSIDDAWSRHVQSSLGVAVLSPPRGRGRGVGRQRAPHYVPPGGEGQTRGHPSNLTFAQEL